MALLVANKALGAIQMESSRTLFCFFVLAVAFALQLSGFLRDGQQSNDNSPNEVCSWLGVEAGAQAADSQTSPLAGAIYNPISSAVLPVCVWGEVKCMWNHCEIKNINHCSKMVNFSFFLFFLFLIFLLCALVTDYLIGTVHQAKGLEFDTVLVADDFVDVPCPRDNNQGRPQFIIGKGIPVCGTHPGLKMEEQSMMLVLILQGCAVLEII